MRIIVGRERVAAGARRDAQAFVERWVGHIQSPRLYVPCQSWPEQRLSRRRRVWATAGLLFIGAASLVTPVNAADVYGTFRAHVIYMDGPNPDGSADSNFKVTNIVTTPSGTISVPHGYTIPPGYTNSNVTFQTVQAQVNAPAVLPKAAVVGGALESPTSRLDFVTYGGNVPVTNRVTGTFFNGNSTERTIFGSGLLSAGGQNGKLAGHPVGHNVVVPEVSAPLPPNSSATVTVVGSGSTEIAQQGAAFHGGDAAFPPTAKAVFVSQLYVGNRSGTVRVDIRTYYDFSSEPKFPEYDSVPEPGHMIDFGRVPVGADRRRTLHISNRGAAALQIDSIDLINAPGVSTYIPSGGDGPTYTIPVGQQMDILLTWDPQSVLHLGDSDAQLRITSNDPAQAVVVYPLRGQSVSQSQYRSIPSPDEDIAFGTVPLGETATAILYIFTEGVADLEIKSIELVESIQPSPNVPGLTCNLCGTSSRTVRRGQPLEVELTWKPESITDLTEKVVTLQVETNDPSNPAITYYIRGKSEDLSAKTLEEAILGWLVDEILARPATRAETAVTAAAADTQTATLALDPAVATSLTAEIPAFLGGGSVQLSNFTGDVTVTLSSLPDDTERKLIRIERGILTAPSVQLPSGTHTGPNLLTFGPPEESGGTLLLANGNYTAYATATIFNQLIPSGLTVRGNYSGVYNAQSGKISVQSDSEDLFVPKDQPLNISTRMRVLEGDNVLIGGFIIVGDDPKKVIIRGIGPSLSGVGAVLADPTLVLRQGATVLASNDNWKENEAEVQSTTIPPSHNNESAIVTTLQPGAYTAVLAGKNNGTGVGVVEVYDLSRAADSRLANISSRGFVDTGNNVMIGGLIIGSPVIVNGVAVPQGGARAMVRAIGPSLGDAGVQNSLQDPTLELRDGNGALVDANDNWRSHNEAEIVGTTIPPARNEESAIVRTLPAGSYTAIVRGVNDTTGVGLVEVYNLQ